MNDPVPLHSSLPFAPFLAVPGAPPKSYPSPLSFRDGFSERHLLQQFAVQLNHNTLSTLALAQEVFSEEKYALLTRLAQ